MRVLRTVFLDEKQIERLNKLSAMTRVQTVYFREAIDIVLAKHEKRLKGKHKKDCRRGGVQLLPS